MISYFNVRETKKITLLDTICIDEGLLCGVCEDQHPDENVAEIIEGQIGKTTTIARELFSDYTCVHCMTIVESEGSLCHHCTQEITDAAQNKSLESASKVLAEIEASRSDSSDHDVALDASIEAAPNAESNERATMDAACSMISLVTQIMSNDKTFTNSAATLA